jgi:hypothetical protein
MKPSDNWTTPYYGVTHMRVTPKGWQFTVTDYRSFAMAVAMPLLNRPFTNFTEVQCSTVNDAKKWCERHANALGQ